MVNKGFEVLNGPSAMSDDKLDLMFKDLVLKSKAEIKKNRYNIDFKFESKRPIFLGFMADVHLGNKGVDYASLSKHINLVNEIDNFYLYLGGDIIDNFIIEKIMEGIDASIMEVSDQWRMAEYLLKRMADKIIAVGNGNHTQWTKTKALFDNLAGIAKRIGVVYTANGALITIHLNNQEYKIHVRHSYKFGSELNRHNSHKRLYDFGPEQVDAVVLEHYHTPDSETFYRHGKKIVALNCGSYKISDSYALRCGFFTSAVGVPVICMFPDEHRLISFETIEDAVIVAKAFNEKYEQFIAEEIKAGK